MNWHIVVRMGADDIYDAGLPNSEPRIDVGLERPTDPWLVSNNIIQRTREIAGVDPEPVAVDLVHLALAVYAADLRIRRASTVDRWSRDLVVHLPVLDKGLWDPAVAHLARMLNFLTGDRWDLKVRDRKPSAAGKTTLAVPGVEAVCLFSGGLDSLVGGLNLLAEGKKVALVGHYGAGVTNSVQERVLKVVSQAYGEGVTPFMFHAQPAKRGVEGEPSMRSRSFLFFAMGVAVASAVGGTAPLVVAENGLISLNVPLTSSRNGSLSTRTTHPHYVALFGEALQRLGLGRQAEMPYRFRTKGEMLQEVKNKTVLAEAAPLTMSCSHPEAGRYRGFSPTNHCGYCLPCIIRQAAMRAAGLKDAPYSASILTSTPSHTEESGRDLRAVEMAVERTRDMTVSQSVFTVLGPGPLPPAEVEQFAGVYLRGMEEVRSLLTERKQTR